MKPKAVPEKQQKIIREEAQQLKL